MQIVQAANPIIIPVLGNIGYHYFYILKDDAGNSIGQINGFQYKDGVPSETGIGGKIVITTNPYSPVNADTIQQVVAVGGQSLIQDKMWKAGIECGVEFNKLNFDYVASDNLGGHNSNAAFSTVAKCMMLDIVPFSQTAGLYDVVLNQETIKAIQAQSGLSTGAGGGGGYIGTGGTGSEMPTESGPPKNGKVVVNFGLEIEDPANPSHPDPGLIADTQSHDPYSSNIDHGYIQVVGVPELVIA